MTRETPLGFTVDFAGSDRSKRVRVAGSTESSNSCAINNNSLSTNSFCDINMNNEMNSDDELSENFDFNTNLTLNNAKIDLTKPNGSIYSTKYHSIPIFIQKPKNERKYKRISNIKKSRTKPEKVKFANVNHLNPTLAYTQRPHSTPCADYYLVPKHNHFIPNQHHLSEYNVKNLSETDTDDYLSHLNRSRHHRAKRPVKKTLNPRETTHYQTNRLSEFTPCQSGLSVCNTSSFINSPIHLLMNYQKSLKQEPHQSACIEPIPEQIDHEPLNFNFSSRYLISLAMLSLLVCTMLNFYETLANLFKVNLTSLIVNKLSCGLIGLLVLVWHAIDNANLSQSCDHYRRYYSVFESKKVEFKEEERNLLKESENSDSSLNQRDNLIVRSSSQLNQIENLENFNLSLINRKKQTNQIQILIYNPKLKFQFCSFVFGILVINLACLSSFVHAYLSHTDAIKSILAHQQIVESALSTLGSLGFVLFFYNLCINLLQMSHRNSNSNGIIVCQIDTDEQRYQSRSLFQRQHHQSAKKMEKIALKFLIVIKLSFALVSAMVFYLDRMTIENSLNKILNSMCIDSLRNDHILMCPLFVAKNKLFDWLSELEKRKIYVYLRAKKLGNHFQFGANQTQIQEASKSYTPIEDFYLMLISLSILILFVSISIGFACIKRDDNDSNQHVPLDQDAAYSGGHSKLDNTSEGGVFVLHLTVLTVFYQGFVKTLFFNELNKWFVGCINGTDHLKNMLFFYGLASFSTILFLSMFIVFCNLRRKLLYFLIFVQQVTILAMLFYWDPAKISDFNSPHIDYVFFGCFALCENLWLTFNLKNLLKKSTDLEKSPVVVLIYGMTVYNFGSFGGYAISFLFCFPIKLYLSIFLLIIISAVYLTSEYFFKNFTIKN